MLFLCQFYSSLVYFYASSTQRFPFPSFFLLLQAAFRILYGEARMSSARTSSHRFLGLLLLLGPSGGDIARRLLPT